MTTTQLTFAVPGNLGTNEGAGANGVLVGALTQTAVGHALLAGAALPCLCITDDGGLYVNETTPANESTGDDVEIVGTTLAADDAIYIGHGTVTFARVDIQITTQGDYTDNVGEWQYWNGSAWTALSGVTDGPTAWEAAASTVAVTFTEPVDWAQCTVDSVLGYWIRWNCTSVTATVTPCQIGQIWIISDSANPTFTSETSDINSAGAGDVSLFPTHAAVDDCFYVAHATEMFCKFKITVSQARTGTATVVWEYYNGSTWATLTCQDDSAGFSTGTATYLISFVPPADWASTTVNSQTGYFIRARISALTTYTAQPLGTQGWVYPISTGADGPSVDQTGTIDNVQLNAGVASATNADSIFLLLNITSGAYDSFTWTKGDYSDTDTVSVAVTDGDKIALIQVQEDQTTEFADANFVFSLTY